MPLKSVQSFEKKVVIIGCFTVGNLSKCMRCFAKQWLFGILYNIEHNLFHIPESWKFATINSNTTDNNVSNSDTPWFWGVFFILTHIESTEICCSLVKAKTQRLHLRQDTMEAVFYSVQND